MSQSKLLWITLPGIGDSILTYSDHGITQRILKQYPQSDLLSVNLHADYYWQKQAIETLTDDIIKPMKSLGYEKIYIIGNSFGGFGALLAAQHNPSSIDGAVLIAPFIGLKEFSEFVSLPRNQWPTEDIGPAQWLATQSSFKSYFLYGDKDRMTPSVEKVKPLISNSTMIEIDGGHNWLTWKKLINHWLALPCHQQQTCFDI